MSEPKRLIEESDSPLERLVLQAGNHAPGGDRLRFKVLMALGVATAVSTTSKTSLAMAAGWKQAIVVGALSCVGVGSVVGYRHFAAQGQPAVVAAAPQVHVGQSPEVTSERQDPERPSEQANAGQLGAQRVGNDEKAARETPQRAAEPAAPKSEVVRGSAEVDSEPTLPETADAPRVGERQRSGVYSKPSPGANKRGARAEGTAPSPAQNVGAQGARNASTGARSHAAAGSSGAGTGAGSSGAGSSGGDNVERQGAERKGADRTQPEHAAAELGSGNVAPSAPPSLLEQELAVLDAARGALAAGRWGDAQRHLRDYASRFPRGKLRLEAEVLRIETLASSGDAEGASRRAKAILERSPNSVVAARLRRFVRE